MKKFRYLMVLGCLAIGAIGAQAAATLDFSNAGVQQGTVVFNGSVLTGSNIAIQALTGANTPQNAGGVTGVNAILSFTSGTCIVCTGGLTFNTGGSLLIHGDISQLSLSNVDLLSATNIDMQWLQVSIAQLNISIPSGSDTKDPTLVSYFFGSQPVTFAFGGTVNYTIGTGLVVSADITNTATPTVVPEPTSLLLLGTAMIGVVIGMRRRRKNPEVS